MSNPIKTKRKKAIRALLPAFCAKCGSTKDLTIDHIIPRVRGGTNELANLQTLCAPCNQQKSRKEQRYSRPAKHKTIKPPMITKLALLTEPAGFTVQVSTTHRTHAGALAHFTELLAQFTQEQRQRQAATAARAAAGGPVLTDATELPHRWEGPGHDGLPLPSTPEAEPPTLARTAEADEHVAPTPPPLFTFGSPENHCPSGEEPPF